MTKHRVRVPQVADISAAIRLYYERTEIGNKDIRAIFGDMGNGRIGRLKQLALEAMHERGTVHYNAQYVNTEVMDDITTLEKTVETAAVRNMDDVYRTTLNRVQLMMGSGSLTLTEAIDLATREFLDKGINCIVYADSRRVNIVDYVRMALRTTSTRATLQGAAKRFAELGYDTVLISQYGGCSETCEPYQGKVYIDDVFTIWNGEKSGDFGKSNYCDKWFMLLSVAIRGGLFHPNCRHTMGQYIEGLTDIPKPIPAEKIREQRALEEKQRAMERKIRALKRKVEGTQDEKKVKEYKAGLGSLQKPEAV